MSDLFNEEEIKSFEENQGKSSVNKRKLTKASSERVGSSSLVQSSSSGGFEEKKMRRSSSSLDVRKYSVMNPPGHRDSAVGYLKGVEHASNILLSAQKDAYNALKLETVKLLGLPTEFRFNRHTTKIESFLRKLSFFKKFKYNQRMKLSECLIHESLTSGQSVYQQGDDNNGYFYVIVQGGCFMAKNKVTDGKSERVKLRSYKAGDTFGEYALVDSAPRRNSVYADTEGVDLFILKRKDYNRLFGGENTGTERQFQQFVEHHPLFKQVPLKFKKQLTSLLTMKRLRKNEVVVLENSKVEAVYFLEKGGCRIIQSVNASKTGANYKSPSTIIAEGVSISILSRGENVGLSQILGNEEYFHYTVVSEENDTEVIVCPLSSFLKYVPIEYPQNEVKLSSLQNQFRKGMIQHFASVTSKNETHEDDSEAVNQNNVLTTKQQSQIKAINRNSPLIEDDNFLNNIVSCDNTKKSLINRSGSPLTMMEEGKHKVAKKSLILQPKSLIVHNEGREGSLKLAEELTAFQRKKAELAHVQIKHSNRLQGSAIVISPPKLGRTLEQNDFPTNQTINQPIAIKKTHVQPIPKCFQDLINIAYEEEGQDEMNDNDEKINHQDNVNNIKDGGKDKDIEDYVLVKEFEVMKKYMRRETMLKYEEDVKTPLTYSDLSEINNLHYSESSLFPYTQMSKPLKDLLKRVDNTNNSEKVMFTNNKSNLKKNELSSSPIKRIFSGEKDKIISIEKNYSHSSAFFVNKKK